MKIKTLHDLKSWNRNPTIETPEISDILYSEFGEMLVKEENDDALELRHEMIVFKMISNAWSYANALSFMKSKLDDRLGNNRRYCGLWKKFEGD